MEYRCIASASLSRKKEDESNGQYYKRIRDSFLNNVFNKTYFFKSKKIIFQTWRRNLSTKENPNTFEYECFYHTVSSLDSNGGLTRKTDIQRYQKCLLTFVILDLCSCDHIRCQLLSIKPDSNNKNRVTLYCDKFNYVIVLEEHTNYYKYVTSFPVSDNNLDKYR